MNNNNENKIVSENEQQEVAQVENKKSVLKVVKDCLTNKYTLIGLGAVALGFAGYKGYQIWKAKKAAQNPETKDDDFEDPTEK